jgi:hypothetical protein
MENSPAALAYSETRCAMVERCRAGVPPSSQDLESLRRLAEAVGLDPSEQQLGLIKELLDLPCVSHIPLDFWYSHQGSLTDLARAEASVHRRLLQLFPPGEGERRGRADRWLGVLSRVGTIDFLADHNAIESGFAASWFNKALADSVRGPGPMIAPGSLFAVLRRIAGRLQLEGVAVTIAVAAHPPRPPFIDADLCDLALELGVPIADPPPNSVISFTIWASPPEDDAERSRDLEHLARDPRFRLILQSAMQQAASYPPFQQKAVLKKGINPLWHKWFSDLIQEMLTAGLPEMHLRLNRLVQSSSPVVFSHFPDLRQQLSGLRVSTALSHTVRSGLLDEFGSDNLDQAIETLKDDAAGDVSVSGPFPFLVISNQRRAIVIGASRPLFEHEFRLPENAELVHLRYAAGQLLVVYFAGEETFAYWSGEPELRVIQDAVRWRDSRLRIRYSAVELGERGVTEGDLAVRPGDPQIPPSRKLLSDGRSFWQERCSQSGCEFFHFDPNTGASAPEPSLPAFFSTFRTPETKLDLNACELLPVPAGMAGTPLGTRSGLIGWRSRHRSEGVTVYWDSENIDHRVFSGSIRDGFRPRALLRFPGRVEETLVASRPAGTHEEIRLYDTVTGQCTASVSTGDRHPTYARGSNYILPPHCWHLLAPRDIPGSLALRKLSDSAAEELFERAVGALNGRHDWASQAHQIIGAVTPEIRSARVKTGLAGIVQHAAVLHNRLHHLLKRTRQPQRTADAAADMLVDTPFEQVASVLQIRRSSRLGVALGRQIRDVVTFFLAPETIVSEDVALSSIGWEFLIGRIGALAYIAVASGTSNAVRAQVLTLLTYWSETPFARDRDKFRTLVLKRQSSELPFMAGERGQYSLFIHDGNRYAAYLHGRSNVVSVLECASSGEFRSLPGVTTLEEQRGDVGFGSATHIARFVSFAKRNGPLRSDRLVVDELSRLTDLSREEATLLWTASRTLGGNEMEMDRGSAEKALRRLRELTAASDERLYLRLYSEAMPEDPESLWQPLGYGPGDHNSFVAQLAEAWNSLLGTFCPATADLADRMEAELCPPLAAALILRALNNLDDAPFLNRDDSWRFDPYGRLVHGESSSDPGWPRIFNPWHWATVNHVRRDRHNVPPVFDGQVLTSVFLAVPYLFLALPVGDTLRSNLSSLHSLVLQRLANPELLVEVGFTTRIEDGRAILALIGENVAIRPLGWSEMKIATVRDSGPFVVFNRDDYFSVSCRPALLSELKGDLLTRIAELCRVSNELSGKVADELLGTPAVVISPALAAQAVMSHGFKALIDRIHNTPVPCGKWEGNPLYSANQTVVELASILRLSLKAAMLHLQRLALPNVASADFQRWNGWTTTEFDDAMAELLGRDLVGTPEDFRLSSSPARAVQRSCSWVRPLIPVHEVFLKIVDDFRRQTPPREQE